MAIQRRKKKKVGNKTKPSVRAKKKRTKDQDQVHEDLKNLKRFESLPVDEDLPGDGQHYCICCARFFVDANTLQAHFRSKQHKKNLKRAREEPWTQKDAEMAGGVSVESAVPAQS